MRDRRLRHLPLRHRLCRGAWGGDLPAVYGHEAAGRVTALGPGVTGFAPGDPVLVTLIRACGACPACAAGDPTSCDHAWDPEPSPLRDATGAPLAQGLKTAAFAESVVVDRSQCVRLPGDLAPELACLLACGVITGVGAVVNTARVRPGASVAVIGAGGVGLNAIQGAALAGAARIVAVDLSADKLAAARAFGATDGVVAGPGAREELRRLTAGRGVDFAFVAVGAPAAIGEATRYLAAGGALVVVGMPPVGATRRLRRDQPRLDEPQHPRLAHGPRRARPRRPLADRPVARRAAEARRADLRALSPGGDQRRHRRHQVRRGAAQRDRLRRRRGMRLRDLEVLVVGNPPPGFGGRYFIFVKLTTDDGIVGWGEVYAATVGPEAMRAVIDDVFARHMAGENPENVELMFRRAYSAGFTQRPDPTVMGAFSGLEIACWDILGKARNRPVHALWGGRVWDRLRSYSYLYPEPGRTRRRSTTTRTPRPNAPRAWRRRASRR